MMINETTTQQTNEELYHEFYIEMYQKACDLYKNTQHDKIKNYCLHEMKTIKEYWTDIMKFDPAELAVFNPENVTV